MTVSWSEKEIAISKDSISAKNPKKIEGMDFLVGIRQDIIITTYEALVSTEDMGFLEVEVYDFYGKGGWKIQDTCSFPFCLKFGDWGLWGLVSITWWWPTFFGSAFEAV